MKKVLALVLALCLALSLAACGGSGSSSSTPAASGSGSEPAASTTPTAAGSVYYLNFKPEQDEAWQALAKAYTAETGVPVTVVTAASGEYETTLMAEMGKSEAPTLFQVNGPVGLANWKDYCYDLSGSDIYTQLTSDDYALKEGDTVYGIAYVIESYGIITNKTLLEKAGYTLEDIQSFEDLKKVAEDITSRKDELGFAAFTSAGMDGSSDWRFKTHLANLPVYFEYQEDGISTTDAIKGTYLDNYKAIWDLYINNSTCEPSELSAKTGDDSRNEFLAGEAVFFQNGSWEYGNLTGEGKYTDDDLAMIPIYIGVGDEANQGLCTGTENYWCVNSEHSTNAIPAALGFVNPCETPAHGRRHGLCHPVQNRAGVPEPVRKAGRRDDRRGQDPGVVELHHHAFRGMEKRRWFCADSVCRRHGRLERRCLRFRGRLGQRGRAERGVSEYRSKMGELGSPIL